MNKERNKKILILVGKISEKKGKLVKLLTNFIDPKIEVRIDAFSSLTFELDSGKVVVKVSGLDIKNFDLVYIRSVDHSLSFVVGALACCLDYLHVKYFDKRFASARATSDKLTSLIILSLNNLPTIPTFFCAREKIVENIDYLIRKFGYPVVAKELSLHHSKGLFVLRNRKDFQELVGEQFLFQKYTPVEKEYRLLVLGNLVKSVQKMYRDLSGPRSYIDYNREEEFIDIGKISDEAKDLAVQSTKALNIQVAGVDILITKKDLKIMVIEVNGNPGFTYDAKLSPEIPELARYLEREVKS